MGVALFHHSTMGVALTGLLVITGYKLGFTSFELVPHLAHEWVTIANLAALLLCFALLANHFERSNIPEVLPRFLPDDWKGGLVLLWLVFFLSSFLDNIAAAIIGAAVASAVYNNKVHLGYLAAIIAAANAGGAGSVVGDTTTTMMWIWGISPFHVTHAYVGSIVATAISGVIASRQQHAFQPIQKDAEANVHIDWARVGIVVMMLGVALATNVTVNVWFTDISNDFPFIGTALLVSVGIGSLIRPTAWDILPEAARGAVFLLSLVLCASMMPVSELPAATWQTTMGLGFVSAVFDNIPLTSLALHQGGYDWGDLAFAVGYGGSMLWFGSSAGVAVTSRFPEARSTVAYIAAGWHVVLGYVVGFLVMIAIAGWNPT
jgi:Na+/H+ antiporter NhaD/arsenite permease-like protein